MGDAAIERYRTQLQLQAHTQIRTREDLLNLTALEFGALEVDESKALRSFFNALRRGYNGKARAAAAGGKAGNGAYGSSAGAAGGPLKRKNGKSSRKRNGNGVH